jgi:site-specific recombinase XerD
LNKTWPAIRERAGLSDVRLHDLRHSYASVAAAGGNSLLVIGAILGHRRSRSTEVYAHLANETVHSAAEATARRIAGAMRSNVVPIR